MTGAATISGPERERIAAVLAEIACTAGEVLRRYHRGPCPHALKADGSPSSAADVEAEDLIVAALAARYPGIAVVAEERAQSVTTRPADLFFLVDPLDGTRDFLAGNAGLLRSISPWSRATARSRQPSRLPASTGSGGRARRRSRPRSGDGASRPGRPVRARPWPETGLVALGSRRHGDTETEACLAALPIGASRDRSAPPSSSA